MGGDEQPVLRNWAGNITFSTARLVRPRTIEELQGVVAAGGPVRALGSGHSFNRVADTTGTLVDVSSLEAGTSIDEAAGTVRVGGGVRYAQLSAQLDARGFALANLGSLPHISVAGACATGTHGSGDGNRCLAAAARGVQFVRGDGELVSVDSSDASFPGSVLALGALGIVTSMELAIEPSYQMRQDVWVDAPLDAVAEQIDAVMGAAYSVSLFIDPRRRDVLRIWTKSRTAAGAPALPAGLGVPADAPQHPIAGLETERATVQLGVPGPWHARLPHFRAEFVPSDGEEIQSEYLLPREHAAAAVRAVCALDLSHVALVFEIRTIAADELWLSPFGGRSTVAVHITWIRDAALVQEACARLESALAPFDPRPHWGKVFTYSPEEVARHYPRLGDFRALAATHDPNRTFGNEFLETFVYE